jgi:hypothetical protein
MKLLLFILGIFAASVWIASTALAQYGSRGDSVHYRQRLKAGNDQSDPRVFTSPPRDPRTWVGDPASRPYVYVPGQGSGGGGF